MFSIVACSLPFVPTVDPLTTISSLSLSISPPLPYPPSLPPALSLFLLIGLMLVVCVIAMGYVDTSQVYHLVRGQSVIKLYVIYNMLDVRWRKEWEVLLVFLFRSLIVWQHQLGRTSLTHSIGCYQRRPRGRETCSLSSFMG